MLQSRQQPALDHLKAGLSHDGDGDDGAKFRNAQGKQARERRLPFSIKTRACHQRYKDGAAETDDEYYCTQPETQADLRFLISHFSAPVRCKYSNALYGAIG